MTDAQLQAIANGLRADLAATPNAVISTYVDNPTTTLTQAMSIRNDVALAAWMNSDSTFMVWRTSVSRSEIYNKTSAAATTWDWTIYKGQSVTEQGAWREMFMGDQADFSQLNLRDGIGKIFGAANAQTTHCLATGKRAARRVEKLFATGTGTTLVPGALVFEGQVSINDVSTALNRFPS